MKRLHIFNPASGSGHSPELLTKGAAMGEESYVTSCVGDAERFTYDICKERPETHFVVYGGDGTVNEVANGIIRAGTGHISLMSVIPAGTGNDFVRTFPEKNRIYEIDALKYNQRYSVNIINFGFDGNVVSKTASYKKVFPGSAAYIAGVVDTFCHKIGEKWTIELTDEQGETETLDSQEYILALAANCKYYGGGFKAATLADPSDGLLDFLAFKKVSRMKFVKLIGDYKKGTHFDSSENAIADKFKAYTVYKKCKSIKISGISQLCCDGELEPAAEAEITVVPKALRIAT